MKNIVMFSGGKDSTAMLLLLIESGIKIDDIVFFDTGVEFPDMYKHIKMVENYIGRKITILKDKYSFEYRLSEYVVHKRNGTIQIGKGFPDFQIRWCTGIKIQTINKYLRKKYNSKNIIKFIGFNFNEIKRMKNKEDEKYPLIDKEMTGDDALNYCIEKGFSWNGLYKHFNRVSCYVCPLKRIGELKSIYQYYPHLWSEIARLEKKSFRKFRPDYSVKELEDKFKREIQEEIK